MISTTSAAPVSPHGSDTVRRKRDLMPPLLEEARRHSVEALYTTAVRTRSTLALTLGLELAAPGSTREDLLELAGNEDSDASGVNPAYLAAYAAMLARRREYEDAYPLFRLAGRLDAQQILPEFQVRYAEAALAVTGSAAEVLTRYDGMTERQRHAFEADQSHPDRGGDPEVWLERFRSFTGMDDLEIAEGDGPLFDRMTAPAGEPVLSSRRISVVMTCFQPDETLFTAIGSVLAQTWQNWELLLVDDASGPEYTAILAKAAALDEERIRVFRLPVNSGTYRARNRAFVESKGTFVTGLDSDDWAHPRWLERQVEPMLRERGVVMTFSNCVRVRENLTAIHTGRPVQGPRSTSIMFRAAPVRTRMGYFDALRKGADTEFHFRFKAVFGNRAVRKLQGEIFTLVRLGNDTLTSSEIGNGWQHPARSAYQSSHQHWRERIRRGQSDGFVEADQPRREFFAPDLNRGVKPDGHRFDELYVVDGRFWEANQQRALELARAAVAGGRSVGIAHVESLLRLRADNRPLRPELLDRMNETGIAFVGAIDPVRVERLVVTDPSLWEGRDDEYAFEHVGDVEVWDAGVEPTPVEPERQRAERAGVSSAPAPRSGRTRPSRRRIAAGGALAALALLCVFAATSWFWAAPDLATAATFAALSALGGAAAAAFTSAGFGRVRYVIDRMLRR